jgi:7-carboxy-7-deazaguanine synthase
MHGQNKVRPLDPGRGEFLQVQDIWYTIQGEGPYFGCPAIFIRLTGCNLRCHFCDTKWDDENDPQMDYHDVVQKVRNLSQANAGCALVVITGGEPLRQNLSQLLGLLEECAFTVQIETAGTYWQDALLMDNVTIVCSPKTKFVHPKIQRHCDEWKYVIRNGEIDDVDGLPAYFTQIKDPLVILQKPIYTLPGFQASLDELGPLNDKYGAPARPPERENVTVWLSPCDEGDDKRTAVNVQLVGKLCLEHGYRAQVQLHKIFGVE